ncbi:hypothetical protein PV327_005075 [Microctonus hyperodae]|uniref:Uncharacterized protein n=1 Tax=Microctonus hyperodae TaxID=165561 RepID=A0AA39G1B9_MICHY|nr:hypothetical protein PV327_005075 [Microctonus hyperodae]
MRIMDTIQAEDYLYPTVETINIVSEIEDSETIDIETEQIVVNNKEFINFIPTSRVEDKLEMGDKTVRTNVVNNEDINKNGGYINMEIQQSVRKISKKKMKNEANWKVTKRSNAALDGKEHVSKSGNNISAKKIQPGCSPCRKKCTEKINERQRLEIFNNYWNENKSWRLK